jgi:hypothetical protein
MKLAIGMLLLALLQADAAAGKRPFTLEDALSLEVLTFNGRSGVSPDGRWIAYAVTGGYRERSGTDLDSTTYALALMCACTPWKGTRFSI